ncbi:AEC family transporter [Halomonas garicola]|uniref:AEC family transporter n=1 Tax=Halomonas garicola TaxID=1690008 RepID=UPI00289D02B2|nr:AEC family transporter [Halomonas garicola]
MPLLEILTRTLEVTLPVFVMVFVGMGLRRIGWIDAAFVATASSLIFKATLPALVFLSLIRADLGEALNLPLLGFFALATLVQFALCWGWARYRVPPSDRGTYIQGAFRGNCGIVGLALAHAMYGDYGLSAGSVLLGLVIVLYNSLSVVALIVHQPGPTGSATTLGRNIATNPLIIAVIAALPFAALDITLPGWVMHTGDLFASLTLPLALICIGGTLSLAALRTSGRSAVSASLFKMLWLPALATLAALASGFHGRELGLLFLYFAAPTATGSFVMARALGGNAPLAANIIAMTTLAASVTVTLGIFTLQLAGWV